MYDGCKMGCNGLTMTICIYILLKHYLNCRSPLLVCTSPYVFMVNHQTLNQNNKLKAAFNINIWVCRTKPDRQQKPHPRAPVSGNHLWSSLEPRNSQCFGVVSSLTSLGSLTLNTQEWMKKMRDLTEHEFI